MKNSPYLLLVFLLLLGYTTATAQTARPIDGYALDLGGEHIDHLFCIGTSKRLFKWDNSNKKWGLHSNAKRNLKRVTTWKNMPVVIDERQLVYLYRGGKFELLPGVFKEVSGNRHGLYGLDVTGKAYQWNSSEGKWTRPAFVPTFANDIALVGKRLYYTDSNNLLMRAPVAGDGKAERLNVPVLDMAGSSNNFLAVVNTKRNIRLFSDDTKKWKDIGMEPDFARLTMVGSSYFATGHNLKVYTRDIIGMPPIVINPELTDALQALNQVKIARNVKLPFFKKPQDIKYQIINGKTIYQGDMIIGTAENVVALPPPAHPVRTDLAKKYDPTNRVVQGLAHATDSSYLWVNGVIPYRLDANFNREERSTILNAIEELNRLTNLEVTLRAGQEDYLFIVKKDLDRSIGGRSKVGRRGGEQELELNSAGFGNRTVIHEILHAAGMYHEQSRPDRDDYIQINFDNVKGDARSNFEKSDPGVIEACGAYDYNSIMHYGGFAFSNNGSPTILSRLTGEPVAGAGTLSDTDVECINYLYKWEGSRSAPTTLTRSRGLQVVVTKVTTIHQEQKMPKHREQDFYVDLEIGSGWRWTPGRDDTATRKWTSEVIDDQNNISPNWRLEAPLHSGVEYAKIAITLKDEEGLRDRARFDLFDINPMASQQAAEILVDTNNGEIYLANTADEPEDFLGYLGENIRIWSYNVERSASLSFVITMN